MACAVIGEDGAAADARLCARAAGALGVSAASGGPAELAWDRRAAVDATSAGLSAAALPRSRFGEFPEPAMPDCERLSAIRDGSAVGSAALLPPIVVLGDSILC